jgi:hypothetical protein
MNSSNKPPNKSNELLDFSSDDEVLENGFKQLERYSGKNKVDAREFKNYNEFVTSLDKSVNITVGRLNKKKVPRDDTKVIEVPALRTELICHPCSEDKSLKPEKILYYESSDRIILPCSYLKVVHNSKRYTHLRLSRNKSSIDVFVGIGDFTAPERHCYLPNWVMDVLGVKSGDKVTVDSVYLPTAKKIKANVPKHIKEYKSVLECALKNHTALFMGKIIRIPMFELNFDIVITELEPDHAVSIIDCEPAIDVNFV